MRLLLKKLFLTIVVGLPLNCFAIPETGGTIPAIDPRESLHQDIENFELNQESSKYYFSKNFPQYAGIHLGAIYGPMIKKDVIRSETIFGLRYCEAYSTDRSWEGGLNLSSGSLVEIYLGQKEENSILYDNKSYYKYALSNFLDASAGALGFIDLQKIEIKAAIGLDNLGGFADKYYSEFGVGVSLVGYQVYVLFGTQLGLHNLSKK